MDRGLGIFLQRFEIGFKPLVEANGVPPVKKAMTNKAVTHKPQEKKSASKPPIPEEIVVIKHDSEKTAEKTMCLDKAKAGERSSKKKAPTLTSNLFARSKAACEKPKENMGNNDL